MNTIKYLSTRIPTDKWDTLTKLAQKRGHKDLVGAMKHWLDEYGQQDYLSHSQHKDEMAYTKMVISFLRDDKSDAMSTIKGLEDRITVMTGLLIGISIMAIAFGFAFLWAMDTKDTEWSTSLPEPFTPVKVVTKGYVEDSVWKSFDDGRTITVYGWKADVEKP